MPSPTPSPTWRPLVAISLGLGGLAAAYVDVATVGLVGTVEEAVKDEDVMFNVAALDVEDVTTEFVILK